MELESERCAYFKVLKPYIKLPSRKTAEIYTLLTTTSSHPHQYHCLNFCLCK